MEPTFVCADCGHRQHEPGKCAACASDPLLDLHDPRVIESLLDDDRRRKDERERKVLWASVIASVVIVLVVSASVKLVALLLLSLPFFSGFILAMVGLALALMKGFAIAFPFRPRFPYLVNV